MKNCLAPMYSEFLSTCTIVSFIPITEIITTVDDYPIMKSINQEKEIKKKKKTRRRN